MLIMNTTWLISYNRTILKCSYFFNEIRVFFIYSLIHFMNTLKKNIHDKRSVEKLFYFVLTCET